MSFSNFIYRQKQRLAYHTTKNIFLKTVAEINKNTKLIEVRDRNFYIKNYNLKFNISKHGFIIDQYRLFNNIINTSDCDFTIIDSDLIFQHDKIKVKVTTAEEIFIIHEIWIEGCYNATLKTKKPIIVVDVGMNVGFASLFFAAKKQVEKVYSYEPFTPTFNQSIINLSLNSRIAHKIKTNNYGLSSKNVIIEVEYAPEQKGRMGIWGTELILEEIKIVNKEKLKLKSFNQELEKLLTKHPNCDFILKIDCEGSEYDIFEMLEPKLLTQVRCILMEWHKKGPITLERFLVSNNFSTLCFNPQSTKVGMLYAFK